MIIDGVEHRSILLRVPKEIHDTLKKWKIDNGEVSLEKMYIKAAKEVYLAKQNKEADGVR